MSKDRGLAARDSGGCDRVLGIALGCTSAFAGALDEEAASEAAGFGGALRGGGFRSGALTAGGAVFARFAGGADAVAFEAVPVGAVGLALLVVELYTVSWFPPVHGDAAVSADAPPSPRNVVGSQCSPSKLLR